MQTIHTAKAPSLEDNMKVIALATAVTFAASTAFAGNMAAESMDAAPMVEMPEMEETSSGGSLSGAAWLIPLIAIAAVVASQD